MKTLELEGVKRESNGKKNTKELRRNGHVPCTLYGGKEQVFFSSEEKNFKNLVYTPDLHEVVLKLNGTEYRAVLHELQFHPVSDNILHADFVELAEGKKVTVNIPVKLVGNSAGVLEGGQLIQKMRKLKIRAIPKRIPDFIEIKIDDLQIGGSIKVGELSLEDLEFLDAENVVIVRVKAPRSLKALEAEIEALAGEGEETAEGTEEGAEGGAEEGGEGEEAKEGGEGEAKEGGEENKSEE